MAPVVAASLLVLSALFLIPGSASAQVSNPGPFVVDLRGTLSSLPRDVSFFPGIPAGTLVPSRSLGIEVGAHVYLFNLGPGRLGIGASLVRARGNAVAVQPASMTPTALTTIPDVETTVQLLAPQLSWNFGSGGGWSYLSAGVGTAVVETTTSAFVTGSGDGALETPRRDTDSGSLRSINFGGGARWFMTGHFAVGFDVRIHKVAAHTRGDRSTAPATLVTASAGLSIK